MTTENPKADIEVIEETPIPLKESRGVPKAPPEPVAPVSNAQERRMRHIPQKKAKSSNLNLSPEGAQYVRVQYLMDLDHKIEDALRPEYWAHVSDKLTKTIAREGDYRGSIIEVRYPDNTMYAELFIRDVQKSGVTVSPINIIFFGPKALTSRIYEDRWNVGAKCFEVVRKDDGEVVFKSRTREKVLEWVDNSKG